MDRFKIPRVSPKTRKALIKGCLVVSVFAIGAKFLFGGSPSLGDLISTVPIVVALFGLSAEPPNSKVEQLTSFDLRSATIGGLVGGTVGGAVLGVCYYFDVAGSRRALIACFMVVPYGALIGTVAAFSMALGVRVFKRIPIFGHWLAVTLGAPFGGAIGSAAVGMWGGILFGRQDLPLAAPWLIVGVGLLCAASIVGGVFAFEFSGSWKKLLFAEATAFFLGSLLFVAGAVLMDHGFVSNQLRRFYGQYIPDLAIAGALMGAISGVLGGVLVCLTYHLYRTFDKALPSPSVSSSAVEKLSDD